MSDYSKYIRQQSTLSDRKLLAWAFAVGERPRASGSAPHRRLNRAMLPDVDFDRAVADPRYRPLLRRIADFLWGGLGRRAEEPSEREVLRAELTAALGERLAAAYLGEDESDDAPIRASEGKSDQHDISRAA
jgi:hypothetical protein